MADPFADLAAALERQRVANEELARWTHRLGVAVVVAFFAAGALLVVTILQLVAMIRADLGAG